MTTMPINGGGFPPVSTNPSNAEIVRLMRYMHDENKGRLSTVEQAVTDLEEWRDGCAEVPGARMEIDRLNQAADRNTWLTRALIVTGLASAGTAAGALWHSVTHSAGR